MGMYVLSWSSVGGPLVDFGQEDWWNSDSKLAVTFTIFGLMIGTCFVWEQVSLYTWRGQADEYD